MDQARLILQEAEELHQASRDMEAISSAFEAMVLAARSSLQGIDVDVPGWEDVVRLFQREALPKMGLSKENQRVLPIVADLYRRVVDSREMAADPITAAACLEDAASFVAEVAKASQGRGE